MAPVSAQIPPLSELTRDAEEPAQTAGQARAYRASTWVWLALAVAGVLATNTRTLLGLVVMVVVVALPVAMIKLLRDAGFAGLCGRERSEQTLACYFRALRRKRWDLVYDALAAEGRSALVRVPRIRELRSHARVLRRSSPAAVAAYWCDFVQTSQHLVRKIARVEWIPVMETDTACRYQVTLTIRYYPAWVLLSVFYLGLLSVFVFWWARKTYRSTFSITTFKRRSQWWVLDGEMGAPEQGTSYVAELPVARVARR